MSSNYYEFFTIFGYLLLAQIGEKRGEMVNSEKKKNLWGPLINSLGVLLPTRCSAAVFFLLGQRAATLVPLLHLPLPLRLVHSTTPHLVHSTAFPSIFPRPTPNRTPHSSLSPYSLFLPH